MLNVPIPANDIHFEYFSHPSMLETNNAISAWIVPARIASWMARKFEPRPERKMAIFPFFFGLR